MASFPEGHKTPGQDGIAATDLTEEEATRYDRQMRLWGIEAQQRCVKVPLLSPFKPIGKNVG